jgi:transcriptional regulator with XRE-family HTH domain
MVAVKYGLSAPTRSTITDFLDLGTEISKISQSTYAAYEFNTDLRPGLEALAALAELLTCRVKDLATFGRFVSPAAERIDGLYPWAEMVGDARVGVEIAIRAILATLRFATSFEKVRVTLASTSFIAEPVSAKRLLDVSGLRLLMITCLWSDVEVALPLPNSEPQVFHFCYRPWQPNGKF